MNIILYFSDQQRYDTINENVTPNIESMADDSIFFDNAFTCQPVCGPARACIQTGLYASQNRCYINGISMDKSDDDTLAKVLNRNGYNNILYRQVAFGVGHNGIQAEIQRRKRGNPSRAARRIQRLLAGCRLPGVHFRCARRIYVRQRQQ